MAKILNLAARTGRAGLPKTAPPQPRGLEEFLRESAWFPMLTETAQQRVLSDCHERAYPTRAIVASRGEVARTWLGVADGLIKVENQTASGKNVIFCAVPTGAWVGEGSVIKKECRRYELVALRPTVVVHVPRATFMWLLETSTDFARFIIDHLNERVGQLIAGNELLRIEMPVARVAAAICNLFNPVLCPNAGPLLNISQEEIGELAGLSRPTTNAALKRLEELGFVHVEYGALLVINFEALRRYSEQEATR